MRWSFGLLVLQSDTLRLAVVQHHDFDHRGNAASLDLGGCDKRGLDVGWNSYADHLSFRHSHVGSCMQNASVLLRYLEFAGRESEVSTAVSVVSWIRWRVTHNSVKNPPLIQLRGAPVASRAWVVRTSTPGLGFATLTIRTDAI
jgi:hypothetical protein